VSSVSSSAERRISVLLDVCILGLLVVVFHFLGNTVENVPSASVFRWMTARWGDRVSYGADYSVGWIVPPVALFLLWRRRAALNMAAQAIYAPGVIVVAGALVLHWVGARVQQPRLSLVSLILLLWGIPLFVLGRQVAAQVAFPCAYLLFCIPWNFLDALTFPLRLLSSSVSAFLLNGLGLPVARSGTVLRSLETGGLDFNVADPCSGLSSLLSMMALTALYANLTQRRWWRQWLLFAMAVPLAMAGNIFRICTVAIAGRLFGKQLALTLYHDYSGYMVFTVSVLLMLACGSLVSSLGSRGCKK